MGGGTRESAGSDSAAGQPGFESTARGSGHTRPTKYDGEVREWLRHHWYTAVLVGLSVATAVFGLLGRRPQQDGWYWTWNVVALVSLTASAILSGLKNSRSEKTARMARREFQVTVNDTLGPLVRELGRLAAMPEQERQRSTRSVIMLALSVTTGVTEASRVRATLYKIGERNGAQALVPDLSVGRGDNAQSVFVRGTREGDDVWKVIDTDTPAFCPDVVREPPTGWDASRKRDYRTFISVGVRRGDEPVGMLTINAPTPGDLTQEDVGTMQVIAALLGTALAVAGP